jgi:hypothetical protein
VTSDDDQSLIVNFCQRGIQVELKDKSVIYPVKVSPDMANTALVIIFQELPKHNQPNVKN